METHQHQSGSVGGFKEGVGGAYRKCRTCMISTSELHTKVNFVSATHILHVHINDIVHYPKCVFFQLKQQQLRPRTLAQHKFYCSLIESPEFSTHFSMQYGVNRPSVLNEMPFFDLCQCLPPDIMHVILEGVLLRNLRLLLEHCIVQEHYFTLHQLNQCVSTFCYGYSEISINQAPLIEIVWLATRTIRL